MPELELEVNGSIIRLEAEASPGQQQAGLVEDARAKFEEAMGVVRHLAVAFTESLKDLSDELTPNEATITFGLKINAEANWVVTKAGGEANFEIGLKWDPRARTGELDK